MWCTETVKESWMCFLFNISSNCFVLQLSSDDTSERRLQMTSVLQEAFDIVNSELQAALRGGDGRGSSSAPSGPLEDDRTMSLLEKYSEQLLQMTQNKLNRIWPGTSRPAAVCTEAERGKNFNFNLSLSDTELLSLTSVLHLKHLIFIFYVRKTFYLFLSHFLYINCTFMLFNKCVSCMSFALFFWMFEC